MGTIRIEYVGVDAYYLGLLGLNHLQLTYEDETDILGTQDYWYVLEGVVDGSAISGGKLGVLGTDGHTWLSSANLASRQELIDKIGTPESRGSRPVISNGGALGQWESMAHYGAEIDDQAFPYIGAAWPFSAKPTINSNSVVASLLWAQGVNIHDVLPTGASGVPGISTLLGTTVDDDLKSYGVFTQVLGGEGKDTLHGALNLIWVEKLYGGYGDDWIKWSKGENIINGGQAGIRYVDDGLDTLDYSGVGEVYIISTRHAVENKSPTYISDFNGGSDQIYSIEQIAWDKANDIVRTGQGVELLERPLLLDLKNSSTGRGDTFSMNSDADAPLIIIVGDDDMASVQTVANAGLDAGYWVRSAEWLEGSQAGDKIYSGSTTLGVEGLGGDDLLDGRTATPFSGQSPLGYDIELYGGDGNDTLIGGSGYTYVNGGQGADRIVVSSMTAGAGPPVEIDVDGADAGDRLYIPYNFFKVDRGSFEGSPLFQLTGAPFKLDDHNPVSQFMWGFGENDQIHGNIEFVGQVAYELDGSDLIITITEGHKEEFVTDNGPFEPAGPTVILSVAEPETATIVRVHNWSDGILGITFPLNWSASDYATAGSFEAYPGWQNAVDYATGADRFAAPLDPRPDRHTPLEIANANQSTVSARTAATALAGPAAGATEGTSGDDILTAGIGGPYHFYGYGGNDTITGSDGGDVIDGGTGSDVMRGGRGNDTYYVDSLGDQVIEDARGGFDRVIASIDYRLGDFVEHVALTDEARSAIGNDLRNTLEGNALDNSLIGAAGDDTLAGNGGDDLLEGGAGSDGYVYELGDGHDTIVDTSLDQNVIVLTGEFSDSDIKFLRDPGASTNLILEFNDGGTITIFDYFGSQGPTISGIELSSGATWSTEKFSARAATATVTSNRDPVAADDRFIYVKGSIFQLPQTVFLDNDRDLNKDSLNIDQISGVSGGAVQLNSDGTITFTADSSQFISFDYRVSDGHGGTDTAHVEMFVSKSSENTAPRITAHVLARVIEDTPASGSLTAVDDQGDVLSYAVKAGAEPNKGRIDLHSDGTFTYSPNVNATGADRFVLTVTDGRSQPVEQQFDVNINPVNDAPMARDDSGFRVASGSRLILHSGQLLANDSDADGDSVKILTVSNSTGGIAKKLSSGDIEFVAANASQGSFKYTITDSYGGLSTATVHISIKQPAPHTIVGTPSADTLYGTGASDVFLGLAGNDKLFGLAGDDVFKFAGDAGYDMIYGGAGYDTALGSSAADILRVNGRLQNLQSAEKIDGGAGFDRIVATTHDDVLDFSKILIRNIEEINLGAGNDLAIGSLGDDIFRGGAGNDRFVFRPGGGNDVVLDFETGQHTGQAHDTLDVRSVHFHSRFDLFHAMEQVGSDTILHLDATTTLRLVNVSMQILFDGNAFVI